MEFIIIIGLILLNGVLSMTEIALVSARKTRLETDANRGSHSAKIALDLSNQPDKFLSTTQIGITLIGILTGLYSGDAFADQFAVYLAKISWLKPYAHWIARITIVLVVTYLTLVLGELVPKRIGMSKSEGVAKMVAGPMNFLSKLASPIVWLLTKSSRLVLKLLGIDTTQKQKVTEEEIRAIVKEGYDVGEVQAVEQDLVGRIFTLGDRDVSSVMTHRSEMTWLDLKDDPQQIREKVRQHLFNVYPVSSGQFDNLLGVVYLKDLFVEMDSDGFTLNSILHKVNYVPETLNVYDALGQFKQALAHYGIVTDEYGTIQGIITLKDIMEALIGDLPQNVEDSDLVKREDGSWLIDGQYSFYDFLEHFNMEDLHTEYDFNTLSGLVLEQLEHIPHTGERFNWMGFIFEIVDMDGARIDKVLVWKRIS